jgi:hypothetical protein
MKNTKLKDYRKCFLEAIRKGKIDEVQSLIEQYNIDVPSFLDETSTINHNIVYYAAEHTKDDYR